MTDYKLVPVEPTAEMMEAGEYAQYTGCYVSGIYADMLAAAPAVQGEPVGYIRKSAIELMKNDELGVRANIIKEPRYRDCVAIYTAPQPAEQQPEDVESIWMYKGSDGEWKPFADEQHRLNTIADGGWDVREFFAAPNVQRGPDVTQLVDALNKVLACRQFELLPGSVQHGVSAAMDAHRKQEGSHESQ